MGGPRTSNPRTAGPDGRKQQVPPTPRPTSRDVAREAGVSQATVSLVLGGKWHGRVSPATADAVRETALRLGYRPNLAARSLRLGRTRTALLVVPALTNEYFARVYTGAARVAAAHDFGVVLYPSPEGVGPARDPFGSARAALDGVIASSMAADALAAISGEAAAAPRESGADGLPLVMLDSDPAQSGAAATVNLDLASGMRQVTGHLAALGHRRIAHIASAVDSWTFRVRRAAFDSATRDLPGAVVTRRAAALSVEGGLRAAHDALTAPGPRPTALVCDDDVLAAGACKAARRLGLRVPLDVSVTGFDDLALATAVEPELTTVRLPADEAGARGMAALLAVVDGGSPQRGDLPVELAIRGSTGPCPVEPR
ncbi:LacI family DNA-binding transcriptional regulator [Streptomyces sp. ICBB 8177]|uniref:LacI family DNA-binding transcriptional regulator n=1 Tax=Streptomyces sp. ICBB 8177 TaxID=563922 RepID=UPI000D673B2C|nr:LacI family DNA-binding transcriptional regulator [Streptomyces sp. ICBB 8177]PWI41982.1 LacI family transcriptional regulator [Streptomyces sp. ICBB 8177]